MTARQAAERHRLVGSPALWEMKRRFQIEFLRARGLRKDDQLLDLGCGTLRGGIPIIEYLEAGHYVGVDIRPETIAEAREELLQHGLDGKRVELRTLDGLADAGLGRRFSVAWAFSVLIHMDDAALGDALAFVARHLAPRGAFYANANIGGRAPGGWQGFPVVWRSIDEYRAFAGRNGLTLEDIGPLDELGHVSGVPAQDSQRMLLFTPVRR